MSVAQIIEADWTWNGRTFKPQLRIEVGTDGRIVEVRAGGSQPTVRLGGLALLPGFVNVHSHAFQRGLRGLGETFPSGAGSFWTWREAMYELVHEMTADRLYSLTCQAFREMLQTGMTTVGEFHYLHHDASCAGYSMDEIIVRAARDVGIRLVLLNTYYKTGGVGKPLYGGQRRFATASPTEYWQAMDRIAARLEPATQTMGAVAHSIRAVALDEIIALHGEARRRGMAFHMHVEEQRKEIEDCIAAYGKRPMALVNEHLRVDDAFTAVHCTHTAPEDMQRFARAGGNICVCPLTEGNLGDGVSDVRLRLAAGAHLCVGTDSNARLCMMEELRWLEYVQRLRTETRGVCVSASGDVARKLLEVATVNGARALGVPAGAIEPGKLADFIAIDLSDPALVGWTPDTLLTALLLGAGERAVARACVGGKWVYERR